MSTDSPIPERWREAVREWRYHPVVPEIALELGTAESFVRDLARDLGTLRKELYDLHHRIDMLTGNKEQAMNIFGLAVTTLDRAVSRIPKELLPK